jgi:hypothetical protein
MPQFSKMKPIEETQYMKMNIRILFFLLLEALTPEIKVKASLIRKKVEMTQEFSALPNYQLSCHQAPTGQLLIL